jgi:transposase InsO family protein/transposase-like protein
VSHANARLTFHGRCELVRRVRGQGRPVAHVAREMGVSRACAHRWVARFDVEGWDGLHDRSSRPHACPTRTSPTAEQAVLTARSQTRRGPAEIARRTGVPERTVTRVLRRHGMPRLAQLDPVTGAVIRASKSTAVRYERDRPGDLIHMDVKKIGRIPDGGGWKAHGRQMGRTSVQKKARIGFDYVHSAIDDHSRLSYSEILPDEKGDTCGAFLARAAAWFQAMGVPVISEVMTDNHWSYTRSTKIAEVLDAIGAKHVTIKPHCPWQNGKVERYQRTMAAEWAYATIYLSNDERAAALPAWQHTYNTERAHTALEGLPPISRVVSPT